MLYACRWTSKVVNQRLPDSFTIIVASWRMRVIDDQSHSSVWILPKFLNYDLWVQLVTSTFEHGMRQCPIFTSLYSCIKLVFCTITHPPVGGNAIPQRMATMYQKKKMESNMHMWTTSKTPHIQYSHSTWWIGWPQEFVMKMRGGCPTPTSVSKISAWKVMYSVQCRLGCCPLVPSAGFY